MGYNPQVILSGRRINDNMGKFIAEKTVKMMLSGGVEIKDTKVGILGLTFKENCPDLRNSKVVDIIHELNAYGIRPMVHDPLADRQQARGYAGVDLSPLQDFRDLGALILAVPHRQYTEFSCQELVDMLRPGGCVIDVKSVLDVDEMKSKACGHWRL